MKKPRKPILPKEEPKRILGIAYKDLFSTDDDNKSIPDLIKMLEAYDDGLNKIEISMGCDGCQYDYGGPCCAHLVVYWQEEVDNPKYEKYLKDLAVYNLKVKNYELNMKFWKLEQNENKL